MALCWAVFEYFIKYHDTKGEMYLALSKKVTVSDNRGGDARGRGA